MIRHGPIEAAASVMPAAGDIAGPPADAARVSVVVLTFNRRAEVLRTLEMLRRHEPHVPIIMVDNASSDGSAEAVALHHPRVCVVRLPVNLGAAGRNAGVERVRTEYVAFCDDDTWWEDASLTRGVALLDASPDAAVLSARVVVGAAGVSDPTCEAMALSPLSGHGLPGPALIGYMAGAAIFRTRAFRDVGGYCPRLFIGGEEELLALDLLARGWRLAYAPMLTLRHCPSPIRDAPRRRQLLARNAVWVASMRLPWGSVARRAAQACVQMWRNRTLLRDGWDTLRGLPWALRHRRPLSAPVLAMLDQVRADEGRRGQSRSHARG